MSKYILGLGIVATGLAIIILGVWSYTPGNRELHEILQEIREADARPAPPPPMEQLSAAVGELAEASSLCYSNMRKAQSETGQSFAGELPFNLCLRYELALEDYGTIFPGTRGQDIYDENCRVDGTSALCESVNLDFQLWRQTSLTIQALMQAS